MCRHRLPHASLYRGEGMRNKDAVGAMDGVGGGGPVRGRKDGEIEAGGKNGFDPGLYRAAPARP